MRESRTAKGAATTRSAVGGARRSAEPIQESLEGLVRNHLSLIRFQLLSDPESEIQHQDIKATLITIKHQLEALEEYSPAFDNALLIERNQLLEKKYTLGLGRKDTKRLKDIEQMLQRLESTNANLAEKNGFERLDRIEKGLDRAEKAIDAFLSRTKQ